MSGTAELCQEIATLREQITQNVDRIASELSKSVALDEATVHRCAAVIQKLCYQAVHIVPKISVAKTAGLDANDPASCVEWAALDRSAFELRNALSQWPKIDELIRSQIPQKRRELMIEPSDTMLSQMQQCDVLFDQLHSLFKPRQQTEDARDHGCFADITLPNSTFVAYVHAAYRVLLAQGVRRPTRFLDVGCGTGFKVMMAARYFDDCVGFDYDPSYVQAAQQLFERAASNTCSVFQADGLTHDGYGAYDVIYFYRPMREDDQLRLLEAQILKHARPRSLIIAPYRVFETRYEEYGCQRIHGWLYAKGISESDATILRKQAEMTGPFVGEVSARGKSLWDPILDSSAQKGFGF